MDRNRLAPAAVAAALALLALPLVTAAQHARPAPYGDRLTVLAAAAPARPAVRVRGAAVEAYDPRSGARSWTYHREGRRPLAVRTAPGHAFALWSDGMVTDTARVLSVDAVRWHRAVPGLAAWLAERPGRAAGVLQQLTPAVRGGGMLAVVTPERIAAYRAADGDLRWTLPARRECAFDPGRIARVAGVLIVAQPCRDRDAWTQELVAVDALGRVTPGRTPLGNELPAASRVRAHGQRA
ncbi:PQQ-binding-like beta-propeller repeat protein [Streptomyces sp. NPDC058301]|uniref:outer membrane protein assembly factor BamB family protein n=1 Tax=Streptomyces sp. NPDC058301 TaxID=3346436 RepID=UPI0036E26D99